MSKSIFKQGKRYTFKDYFDLSNPTEEIVNTLGYSFFTEVLELPEATNISESAIQSLQDLYYQIIPKITLTSEIAKREFLISPILLEVVKNTDSRINVEYPIEVNDLLSGSLDYLLKSKQEIVVIEAKKGDLDRGFNQLAAELIALDQYEDSSEQKYLYGAITVGDVWKFGILERASRKVTKDIHSYRVPEDTKRVVSILVGILR